MAINLNETALKRAEAVYNDRDGASFRVLSDAIRAYLAALPVAPVAVSVKPLRWEQPDGDAATETSCWLGHGLEPCEYYIRWIEGEWWMPGDLGDEAEPFQTLEAAKAAAQSDFNARILSSIIPATKGGEDADVGPQEAARDLFEAFDRDFRTVGYRADLWDCLRAALAQDTAATPPVAPTGTVEDDEYHCPQCDEPECDCYVSQRKPSAREIETALSAPTVEGAGL